MDLRLGGGLNLFIGHTLPLCGMKAMLWTPISVLHPSYSLCSLRCPTLAAALGHTHTLDGEDEKLHHSAFRMAYHFSSSPFLSQENKQD